MRHIHHIIPRHMGGGDDPSNLVYLSVEEHAEAHHRLWEEHGHWEDRIAWLGLSGQIGKEEVMKQLLSNAAKKGNAKRKGENHPFYGKKRPKQSLVMKSKAFGKFRTKEHQEKLDNRFNQKYIERVSNSISRDWIVIQPNGTKIIIHNMDKFCKDNGLNKSCMSAVSKGKQKTHKGYFCSKVS